jgi:TPR repeat protein
MSDTTLGDDLFAIAEKYQIAGDFENAMKYYQFSASKGNQSALTVLGYTYLQQGEYSKAKESFEAASVTGHVHYGLALCHHYLSTNNSNRKEIMEQLVQAQKHTMGAAAYSLHYIHDINSVEDQKILGGSLIDDPYRMLRYAADTGHINAIHDMGFKYYEVENYTKAVEMFLRSASNGFISSFVGLGNCLLNDTNMLAAKKCFMIAIRYGSFDAYAGLGDYYEKLANHSIDDTPDIARNFINLTKSCYDTGVKNKNRMCIYRTACMHIKYESDKKILNDAIKSLEYGAHKNHIPSIIELIRNSECHNNFRRNHKHTLMNLYNEAIRLGSVMAMYMLGKYYLDGLIDKTFPDPQGTALTYLKLAANRGLMKAHEALGDYFEHMYYEAHPREHKYYYNKMIEHLTIASKGDNMYAKSKLKNWNGK